MGEFQEFTEALFGQLSVEIDEEKEIIKLASRAKEDLKGKVEFNNLESILVAYQNSAIAQKIAAQTIFGAIDAKGVLPVSIKNKFPEGTGISTKDLKAFYSANQDLFTPSPKLHLIKLSFASDQRASGITAKDFLADNALLSSRSFAKRNASASAIRLSSAIKRSCLAAAPLSPFAPKLIILSFM